ncbi:hypothetical protein FHS85_005154 [Rhodoligotrophos appendicifer]
MVWAGLVLLVLYWIAAVTMPTALLLTIAHALQFLVATAVRQPMRQLL